MRARFFLSAFSRPPHWSCESYIYSHVLRNSTQINPETRFNQ